MNLFKLFGTIAIQNKDALEGIDETTQAGDKASSKLSGAFSKIGSAAVACGKVIATGLAAGAAAFGALTVKALNAAGELEQNMGGSEAVFGEYATKMQKTAENAFSSMGLSASDFLGTANKMGSLFKGAGFDVEEASELTATAMQRAADVASIMGLDVSVAMESIAGAAKGNFTMMDNLGVAMNDNTLQAYAYAQGIDKATKDMTNQEKIGLAMQMFLEKTADYAGNYAKENETLAGSLTTAKAALKNFLSGVGDASTLGDALVSTGNVIASKLTELLPSLVTGITNLINQLIPQIPPLLEKVLPGVIEGAVVLLKGLVKALPSLAKNLISSLFKSFGSELSNQLGNSVGNAIESVLGALSKVAGIVMDALGKLLPVVSDIIDLFADGIDTLTESESLGQGICDIIDAVIKLVKKVVDVIKGFAQKTKPIVDFITDSTGMIFSGIAAIIEVIADAVGWIGDFFGLTYEAAGAAYELSEAEKEIAEQAEKAREKHKELMDEFGSEAKTIEEEAQRTRELWEELKKCVDANGDVKKGYEDRAAYVVSELRKNADLELEIIDGQVRGYQTLASEIDNVIKKQQAQSLYEKYGANYEEAEADKNTLFANYQTKSAAYDTATEAAAQENIEWSQYRTGLSDDTAQRFAYYYESGNVDVNNQNGLTDDGSTTSYATYKAYRDEYETAIQRQTDALNERNAAESDYQESVLTTYRYETASARMAAGDWQGAIDILTEATATLEYYRSKVGKLSEAEIASLQEMADVAYEQMMYHWDQMNAGTEGFTAEDFNKLQAHYNEIAGLLEEATKDQNEIVRKYAEGTSKIMGYVYENGELVGKKIVSTLKGTFELIYKDGKLVGKNLIDGIQEGIAEGTPALVTSAGMTTRRALDEMRTVAQIKSPSRVTRGFGRYLMEGLALGIEDEEDMAVAAAESAALNTLDAMSMDFGSANIPSVDHVISGAVDTKQELRSLIESLPDLITYAISNGLSLNINNREFARMVKAVT